MIIYQSASDSPEAARKLLLEDEVISWESLTSVSLTRCIDCLSPISVSVIVHNCPESESIEGIGLKLLDMTLNIVTV